jgi:hypothetical protein
VSTVSFEEMVSEKIRLSDAPSNGAGVGPINTSKQFNQGRRFLERPGSQNHWGCA